MDLLTVFTPEQKLKGQQHHLSVVGEIASAEFVQAKKTKISSKWNKSDLQTRVSSSNITTILSPRTARNQRDESGKKHSMFSEGTLAPIDALSNRGKMFRNKSMFNTR